jgi:hypothetical protein
VWKQGRHEIHPEMMGKTMLEENHIPFKCIAI